MHAHKAHGKQYHWSSWPGGVWRGEQVFCELKACVCASVSDRRDVPEFVRLRVRQISVCKWEPMLPVVAAAAAQWEHKWPRRQSRKAANCIIASIRCRQLGRGVARAQFVTIGRSLARSRSYRAHGRSGVTFVARRHSRRAGNKSALQRAEIDCPRDHSRLLHNKAAQCASQLGW